VDGELGSAQCISCKLVGMMDRRLEFESVAKYQHCVTQDLPLPDILFY